MQIISRKLEFNSKNLRRLMDILWSTGCEARLVGGCVRDNILAITSYDIDIATSMRPDEVISLLIKNNIKAIPTGLNFGTVTAVIEDETFEITSLRKDIKCDGRHAIVEFTDDFALDALRRDFTINALSYCILEQKIYDYTNGLEDIRKKRVRFIGEPLERIKEDYLRILRFFRFSAGYAYEIDELGLKASIASKHMLSNLARERINLEMDKLLISKGAARILSAMKDNDIDVMAGLNMNIIDSSAAPLNLHSLYAVLLINNDPAILSQALPSLRFSKKRAHDILDLVKFMNSSFSSQNFLEIWVDNKDVQQYILVAFTLGLIGKDEMQSLALRCSTLPPKLPITGDDLLVLSGKEIGAVLLKIKKAWIASDLTLDKNALMEGIL